MAPGSQPAMALVFRRLERPRPLQPQKLRGLGGESWPDAGRPRSAEPTTRTLNYGGLGRVAGARPATPEASAPAVAGRTDGEGSRWGRSPSLRVSDAVAFPGGRGAPGACPDRPMGVKPRGPCSLR